MKIEKGLSDEYVRGYKDAVVDAARSIRQVGLAGPGKGREMIVHNVRLGLATNSSSTHSLVFVSGMAPKDRMVDDREFGWDFWTAASKEAKLDYLALQLHHNLCRSLPPFVADAVSRDWLGVRRREGWGDDSDGSIDHQSVWSLPVRHGTNVVDQRFFEQLRDYVLRPNLVILGGNDNTSASHPLVRPGRVPFRLPLDVDAGDVLPVCRYDEARKFWTIFEPRSGTKIRFSFDAAPIPRSQDMAVEVDKAAAPELVDLKITDQCPFDCPMCYMGSTAEGRHASEYHVRHVLDALAEMEVFEVAMGGGEPTLHPKFPEMIEHARGLGIVPNFTTKNIAWLRDPSLAPRILGACGAFAFSVDKHDYKERIRTLRALLEVLGVKDDCNGRPRATIQAIIGPVDPTFNTAYDLSCLVRECAEYKFPLTLLGYKDTGRGGTHRESAMPHDVRMVREPGWWVDTVKAEEGVASKRGLNCRIGIDTMLADDGADKLDDSGVPRMLYTTKEGKFSCYVDVVAKKIGPCSYCDDDEFVSLRDTERSDDFPFDLADPIRDAFQSF